MVRSRKQSPDVTATSRSRSRSRPVAKKPTIQVAEFKARSSLLDSGTSDQDLNGEFEDAWRTVTGVPFAQQPFSRQIQGWIHLFWFIISYYVAAGWYEHFKKTNSWFGPTSWKLMHLTYRDWWGLFHWDVFLIGWTFVAVPVQYLIAKGGLPAKGALSWCLRHILALSPIFIAVHVCLKNFAWPALQVATILMHSTVLFFKMHSYFTNNADLHEAYERLNGRKKNRADYPANLTLWNFFDYLLVPTLVYSPEYPRTNKIRLSFLIDRMIGAFVIVSIIYLNIDMFIMPVLGKAAQLTFFDSLTKLLLPISLNIILLFFLVFEYILNWFAEVTRFADRRFYDDWWNSLDQAEFSRKWNIPIHKFLQRHVYLACRVKHGWSRFASASWTFLFSSILHELIMSMAVRKLRWEFFVTQMMQIPLIWATTSFALNRFPRFANIFFWIGLMAGSTGLMIIYAGGHPLK